MMVHLRGARKQEREEIPIHFEGSSLVGWARLVGWSGGALAALVGVTLMLRFAGTEGEVAGAGIATLGMCALVAVARCRRYETVIGPRWLRTSCGPFRSDLARALIVSSHQRPATSWRRLFARQELVLELEGSLPGPLLPSNEPGELIHLLALHEPNQVEIALSGSS